MKKTGAANIMAAELEELIALHAQEQEGLGNPPTPEEWDAAVNRAAKALKEYKGASPDEQEELPW